jgi:hypothetical protein
MHAQSTAPIPPRRMRPAIGLIVAAILTAGAAGCSSLGLRGGNPYRSTSSYQPAASSAYGNSDQVVYDFFFQLGRVLGEALQ